MARYSGKPKWWANEKEWRTAGRTGKDIHDTKRGIYARRKWRKQDENGTWHGGHGKLESTDSICRLSNSQFQSNPIILCTQHTHEWNIQSGISHCENIELKNIRFRNSRGMQPAIWRSTIRWKMCEFVTVDCNVRTTSDREEKRVQCARMRKQQL